MINFFTVLFISVNYIHLVIIISILLIATLIRALDKAFENYKDIKQNLIPKIKYVRKEESTGFIICLLEHSDLFATDLMISVFYTDEFGFEALVGVGYIINVQIDRKIQAVINQPISTYQDILDKLANNDNTVLNKISFRPSITISFLNELKRRN